MKLFSIDEKLCKRDGICAAECPVMIITKPDKNIFPQPVENAESLCIKCGHCVAICPHGAFSHSKIKPEDCAVINESLQISPEMAEQFLAGRRSTRCYKSEPVEKETLLKLIDIARHAPSGHNSQLAEWMVVHDPKDVKKYAGMVVDWMRYMIKEKPELMAGFNLELIVKEWDRGNDRVCRDAPHLIIAHGPVKNPMSKDSCTIAMAYFELAASGMGLGACWAGFFNIAAANWPPLNKELKFPEGNNAMGSMMTGYPKYRYRLIPRRKKPKVIWLGNQPDDTQNRS